LRDGRAEQLRPGRALPVAAAQKAQTTPNRHGVGYRRLTDGGICGFVWRGAGPSLLASVDIDLCDFRHL